MSQEHKKKDIGYYFRIEFSSLQGKITTGFCGLGIVAGILMLTTASLLQPSLERFGFITEVIYPTHLQISLLQNNISTAISHSEKKFLKNEPREKKGELSKIISDIQQPLDSLTSLSAAWENKEDIYSFQIAHNKAENVIKNLKKAHESRDSAVLANLYFETLPTLNKEIQGSLATILNNQSDLHDHYSFLNAEREQNLWWILFVCFITAWITGSILGSYIVTQVLKVIRSLKYSILELSEGTLIAPIPPSKNELNSIGKAVNILTDNLRNISEFANEVGKGNFENNKLKFDNQGELAKSLFEMQESLKRVAEEDRVRQWTSEGIASFNEYLRQSEVNINEFASTLISKIIKHLNVNQGSLYILNKDNDEKAVLELMGCYAYDRQKFINKTIEPGQGLVGQVFLEKEYIYIKDIPKNYISITSGLGEKTANYLLIMPIKVNEEVNGVIELASFTEFPEYKISFVEKLAETISSAIAQVHSSQVTTQLLQEAQKMSVELKAQEEVLRQNSEELMATQENLSREIAGIKEELKFSEAALLHHPSPQIILNENYTIRWWNKAAEKLFHSNMAMLNGKAFTEMLAMQSEESIEKITAPLCGGSAPTVTAKINIKQDELEARISSFSAGKEKYYSLCLEKKGLQV